MCHCYSPATASAHSNLERHYGNGRSGKSAAHTAGGLLLGCVEGRKEGRGRERREGEGRGCIAIGVDAKINKQTDKRMWEK